jgi:hypothetical protein
LDIKLFLEVPTSWYSVKIQSVIVAFHLLKQGGIAAGVVSLIEAIANKNDVKIGKIKAQEHFTLF